MYVVIFRALRAARNGDADDGEAYAQWALRMRIKAQAEYGCLEFISTQHGDEEVSLSYRPDTASIQAWQADFEHRQAQALGRQHWYLSYQVEVAQLQRCYQFPAQVALADAQPTARPKPTKL